MGDWRWLWRGEVDGKLLWVCTETAHYELVNACLKSNVILVSLAQYTQLSHARALEFTTCYCSLTW
jgi:hypothetical protein